MSAVRAVGESTEIHTTVAIEASPEPAKVPNSRCDISSWFSMNDTFANNSTASVSSALENRITYKESHLRDTLNGTCDSKNQTACSVETVLMRYSDANGNVREVLSECAEGSPNWTETTTDVSGAFDANSQTLTDVTVETSLAVTRTDQLELNNVTKLAISNFDSHLLMEMDHDSRIWGTYNQGSYTEFWINYQFGEPLKKIVTSVEDSVVFALTTKGNAYYTWGEKGNKSILGMGGVGNDNVTYLSTPLMPDGSPLTNVDELSVGLKSVCATAAVLDKDGKPTTEKALYCWGSSVMGQLGFDNMDGGFSMNEMNSDWDGHTSRNKYLEKMSRMELNPKLIEFSAPADGK